LGTAHERSMHAVYRAKQHAALQTGESSERQGQTKLPAWGHGVGRECGGKPPRWAKRGEARGVSQSKRQKKNNEIIRQNDTTSEPIVSAHRARQAQEPPSPPAPPPP